MSERQEGVEHHDVIVIGAGFGGLYAIHRLRGQGLDLLCLEASDEVGGVWNHNRYPGARCDLLSVDYSYSFSEELQRDWTWSHRYSPQSEILRYLQHVANRFDLRRSIRFDSRVTGLHRDDADGLWHVETKDGTRFTARFVVMASGPFTVPKAPDFPGFEEYRGDVNYTCAWPRDPVEVAGKRVGVIGTGSSGVQVITALAQTAGHLTVFQRTPAFSAPAYNRPSNPVEVAAMRDRYPDYRAEMKAGFVGAYMFSSGRNAADCTPAEQRAILDDFWTEGGMGYVSAFNDVLFDESANAIVADYLREKMAERIADPELLEKLTPRGYAVGTRRPVCDSGYFEVYAQPNVSLVDLRTTPIVRFTETGIETSNGHHDLDMVVLATGFDAITGSFTAIDPVNGAGEHLVDHWREGPRTYLGLGVAGFPNLFLVNGPGAATAANVPLMVELSVDWIGDCIAWLSAQGLGEIAPRAEAEDAWHAEVLAIGEASLFMKTPSWFTGGNIAGKPRGLLVYLGGFASFGEKCRAEAEAGYPSYVTS